MGRIDLTRARAETLAWARVQRRRAMIRGLATGSGDDLELAERALAIAREVAAGDPEVQSDAKSILRNIKDLTARVTAGPRRDV